LKVSPEVMAMREESLTVKISLSPLLSGTSEIKLSGYAIDCWGLIQSRFEIIPIRLHVIPKAKYAVWLAKKYLAETKPGSLPLTSNVSAIKPVYGLRRGVEYYGNRSYRLGDSLKNISWKHSLKHHELISKEFAEFQGQPAIVLINLVAGNAEEADDLAYKIITTAISLARENIPAALAAYDHEHVKITTSTLHPRQFLLQCLQIAGEIVTLVNPTRYLNPPDFKRLKLDIGRIRLAKGRASNLVLQLLLLEYKSLVNNARLNPATKAILGAYDRVDKQSNVVVISQRNHDAAALTFNTFNLARKGNAVINI